MLDLFYSFPPKIKIFFYLFVLFSLFGLFKTVLTNFKLPDKSIQEELIE